MKNFSFDSLNGLTDVYFVTVNGNELVSFDVNKKPCLREHFKAEHSVL